MEYFLLSSRGGLTVAEAIDIIFSHEAGEVFIEATEPNADTDEDSGDEDETTLDNLTGRQLAAPAEVVFLGDIRIGEILDEENTPLEVEELSTSSPQSRAEKWAFEFLKKESEDKRKKKVAKKWCIDCNLE